MSCCNQCNCTPCDCNNLFQCSPKCNLDRTTTTTSFTTHSTTSTTTTSTSTTTLASTLFTIDNNTSYDDIYYKVYNGSTIFLEGYVQSGGEISTSFTRIGATVDIYVQQFQSIPMNVTALRKSNGSTVQTTNYVGTTTITYTAVNAAVTSIEVELNPYTTTTTTTTSTSTSTSTSTTTTSTTTSSTTTTTEMAENLEIDVLSLGNRIIGITTTGWNIQSIPPPGSDIITNYYTPITSTLAPPDTQNVYNGDFLSGNSIKLTLRNTASYSESVYVYFSNNNGISFVLLGAYDLLSLQSTTNTYSVTRGGPGANNILEIRVNAF